MDNKAIEAIMSEVNRQIEDGVTASKQLRLGDLIHQLEQVSDPTKRVRFDFCRLKPTSFDSFRGFYDHLALGWEDTYADMTTLQLLDMAKACVGTVFVGYKGGDYRMTINTPVWVANHGDSGDTAIRGIVEEEYEVLIDTFYCAL